MEFISDLWKEVHGGHIAPTKEIRNGTRGKITTETRAVTNASLESDSEANATEAANAAQAQHNE